MSELLGINIKTLYDGGFHFFQTGLIRKVLEATVTDHCNGLPTPIKVEAPIVMKKNGSEAKRDFPKSNASVIGMIMYLESNKKPDIYFDVNKCVWFTHNTKASHETYVKRICWYLQGTKNTSLLFNPYKKMMVDFYADAYFLGQWGHKNPQDPICDSSRTGSVTTFSIFPLLWVKKLQTYISIYILHYEYVELFQSVRELITLKSLIKEFIDNLGIDSEKLKFVSISTVYEDNNGAIVVAISTRTTLTPNHIMLESTVS